MDFLDNDSLLYLGIIILALVFFLWNQKRSKKNKQDRKKSFRKRYEERKRKS